MAVATCQPALELTPVPAAPSADPSREHGQPWAQHLLPLQQSQQELWPNLASPASTGAQLRTGMIIPT